MAANADSGSAVRLATPDQLDALARVLAAAFADDPITRWPFPDLPDPAAALRVCFRAWNAPSIELGLVVEVAGGAGFALWVPPDRAEAWQEAESLARRPV